MQPVPNGQDCVRKCRWSDYRTPCPKSGTGFPRIQHRNPVHSRDHHKSGCPTLAKLGWDLARTLPASCGPVGFHFDSAVFPECVMLET